MMEQKNYWNLVSNTKEFTTPFQTDIFCSYVNKDSKDKYGIYGVFELPEGAILRHHDEKQLYHLLAGFATAYLEGKEVKLCLTGKMNEGFQDYLHNHSDDKRLRMVNTEDKLYEGKTCYFTFIAPKDELQPLYERVKKIKGINCVFQQDKYRPEYWLEICPQNATKATAIKRVKELCGCQKVIVFGDSVNDIPMFYMADEAYAVKNAIDELKAIATGTIGDNNSDGVAKWLKANMTKTEGLY